jgi:mono/diheme cytochrome c family protein
MFKLLRRLILTVLVLAGVAAVAAGAVLMSGGISAREAPGRIESALAPRLRSLAIPREARERRNPVADSAAVIAEGMEHYADHCAICHANDGSGDTEMGRGLYPRVPDMRRAATQDLADGELFYIIENGVKLTGMPAWGGEGHEGDSSWKLVRFIRHIPKLSSSELERMKDLNPKAPDEWKEQQDAKKFLEGEAPPHPAAPHKHGGRKE